MKKELKLEILEKLSYSDITEAENGKEALKCIKTQNKSNQFNVILLDLKMPVMNGYDFFESLQTYIQDQPQLKMPYVIALTASAMNTDKERCLAMGMNQYLAKPIDIGALRDILNRL